MTTCGSRIIFIGLELIQESNASWKKITHCFQLTFNYETSICFYIPTNFVKRVSVNYGPELSPPRKPELTSRMAQLSDYRKPNIYSVYRIQL